jgi:2-polyprenyl-3-methyl-5-hydroxy-6-metoxy-1,4-benzoquinol methylase
MAEKTNDRALRFYNQVLGLERLHYGLWQLQDELTLDNLKAAQQRYENLLTESIPDDAKVVLDVGCGTGVMAARLKSLGYDVEGMTPDIHQKKLIEAKAEIHLHFCKFEDFQPAKGYDCIIMSESAQYIPLQKLFDVAAKALRRSGYLMVCDYFVLNHARGIMAKSGHNFDAFMEAAGTHGFNVLKSKDITSETAKSLEMADDVCNRALLAVDIATEKIRKRHPALTRLVLRLLRGKIGKLTQERRLIDAELFKASKRYQFLLFQAAA